MFIFYCSVFGARHGHPNGIRQS